MPDMVLDRTMLGQPQEKHWISYIKQRIKKNKNFLGFISGQTGSGKSWSTLRICEELDNEFNIERVVFSGLELMELINSGKLRKGSAICFEEVGVEMNSRNWASITNKMLHYLLQTFRHKGFILIMNSPFMDFVDSATRKLFHAEMQTIGIDFEKGEVRLKPQLIQYNSRLQKFYYKRLRVIRPEGVVPVDVWRVNKPSKALIEAYEQKKTDYTTKLNQKIMVELQSLDSKERADIKHRSYGKPLTEIQAQLVNDLKEGKSLKDIITQRQKPYNTLRSMMTHLHKKGYRFILAKKVGEHNYYNVQEPSANRKSDNISQ